MLRISQKPLFLAVTVVLASSYAELSHANPTDSKSNSTKAGSSSAKPVTTSRNPVSSSAKPVSSTTKSSASKSKPVVSDSPGSLTDLYDDEGTGRKHSRRSGKREHNNREKRGGGRWKDDMPNFRKVKTLESLTPVQEAKITHILKAQREKSLPFSEKLREIRESSSDSSDGDTGRRRKTPEIAGLRRKIHAIKNDAWLQIQKILTPRQKIELEALQESGPPRRKHPDAQPAVHDSGKSFSR